MYVSVRETHIKLQVQKREILSLGGGTVTSAEIRTERVCPQILAGRLWPCRCRSSRRQTVGDRKCHLLPAPDELAGIGMPFGSRPVSRSHE